MNTSAALCLLCLLSVSFFSSEALGLVKRRSHRSHKEIAAGVHIEAQTSRDTDDQDGDDKEGDDEEDDQEETRLSEGVTSAQTALDDNLAEQKRLQSKIDEFKDKNASDLEIEGDAKLVSNETQSMALGDMMGSMWKEMRMFEVPSYSDHVRAELAEVKGTELKLRKDLAKAKAKENGTEDEEKDDSSQKKEDQHKASKAGLLVSGEIFPVPTTSRCIVIMVCQYMIIYTALAIIRTYHELSGTPKGKMEAGMRAAAQTLTYGPMLCVLFIACRMRVEFLSDGKGQPQDWVQNCMYALTFSVLASTLLVLFMPLVTGKPLALKEGSCDLERLDVKESGSKAVFYTLTAARYLILLGLYGGLAGVIVGICTYLPPGATDLSSLPPPAPAVMCTMILAVLFFVTQLAIAVCRSYAEFTGVEFPKVVGVMSAAANTVEFAPQLAILFLATRMRALQHDGQPQAWAQNCMYAATFALCVTAILACAVPVVMGGSMKINPVTKEATFEVPNPRLGYALVGIRFLCMAGFYGGAVGVAYSIFAFEAPKGDTLPVSPTVHCVINLTIQFFFVYLMQTVMLTVSEVSGGKLQLEKYRLFAAVEATKSTLAFAPMLSILFVTTRMYALLLTDKKGAPQAWVQDGMYMATWSLLISFVACMASGLALDKVETDEDGNVVNKFSNRAVSIAMMVVRYIAVLLLYGGIAMVVVGLFVMTPETANGRGSVPVVSDVVNKTPVGNPPPGPQDVTAR